ncbi:LytTR family DNA-binding domain-containing protein [Pedobacter sp. Du54]|uniref:LytR/AlgR family response regulator transcription factor n=1 Tax=Pedobacter anseongensis TaxID=3133439 RepID=UPI0030AC6F18
MIDDDPICIDRLEDQIKKIPELIFKESYTDPLMAFKVMSATGFPDILFLDVDMEQMSGLEFITIMPQHVATILVTGHSEFALQAFEKDAVHFLLKPFSFVMFAKAVEKAKFKVSALANQSSDLIVNKADRKMDQPILINPGYRGTAFQLKALEIIYIEATAHSVYIKCINDEYKVNTSISVVESELPPNFLRVHRSFIVNIDLIKSLNFSEIFMENNKVIPIGKSYFETVLNKIKARSIVISGGR